MNPTILADVYWTHTHTHTHTLTHLVMPYGAKQHQVSCLLHTMLTQSTVPLFLLFSPRYYLSIFSLLFMLFRSRISPSTTPSDGTSLSHL